MCVKTITKKDIPAWRKFTQNSGVEQIISEIKSLLRKKSNELQIKLHGIERDSRGYVVFASTRGNRAVCPYCGKTSKTVHSYRLRRIQCGDVMGHPVSIVLQVGHFVCKNKKCEHKIFAERTVIADAYQRMSNEVMEKVRHEAINQPARAAVRTLSMQNISVSASLCHRLVRKIGSENPDVVHTSGYVGIDDFAKCKGRTYMCKIVDHYTGDVLAVFDSRYGHEIVEWFVAHPDIKLVTRDGSSVYASLIAEASAEIIQVSDRFHLVKNLKEMAVDMIKKMLGKREKPLTYPSPSESEAMEMITSDMCSMGDERHRTKVQRYYRIRALLGEGQSVSEISRNLSLRSQLVYELKNTDISKILSKDQKSILRHMRKMASITAGGIIDVDAVARRMKGLLESRLVCRCMRSITAKYGPIRRAVRECNKKIKQSEPLSISARSIWNYIRTGKTDSEKMATLGQTHPLVGSIINVCVRFCKMIHGEDDAPDIDTWIKEAQGCKNRQISSFANYVLRDRNAIEQACLTNFSNAKLEGNVNRTKAIKRSMYNRAKPKTLRAKIIYTGRNEALKYHLNW